MHSFLSPVVSYVTAIVGGCLLVFGSFSVRYRQSLALLRTVMWFGGSLVAVWGIIGLGYWYGYYHLTEGARMRLYQVKTIFGGGSLTLLILLITSRDLWKARKPN